jgi:hypothetical protein
MPRLRAALAWWCGLLLAAGTLAGAAGVARPAPAAAAVAVPPTPAGLPAAIEPPSPYLPQRGCDYHPKPGVAAFAALLVRTYPDSGRGRILTTCLQAGRTSEHAEGRAFDWTVSVGNPRQVAEVNALLAWLLASDRAGNRFAMARRLGLMYIMWNRRIWGAYAAEQGWRPYACAGVTACHMDHVHFSFGWAGAWQRTSYWTGRPARVDYGPCVAGGQRYAPAWTHANPTPCARVPAPPPPTSDLAVLRQDENLVVVAGDAGAPVAVIQRQLGAAVTGAADPATVARVMAFQRAHHLPASGQVVPATWRALAAAAAATPPTGFASLVSRNSGKCLDVTAASRANGARLQQWRCTGGANQQFQLQATGGGWSMLLARHSGKVVDVAGRSRADGASVWQWTWLGGANQQWRPVPVGGGAVELVSRNSGRCLDVTAKSRADGARLQQWRCTGGANQQFTFG